MKRVVHEDGRVTGIELADEGTETFDHVVSTMPLTLLVRGLGELPAEVEQAAAELTFRNTILVYLCVDASDLFPDQWFYIHSPDLRMGRLANFRNWAPELCRDHTETILALEYWCYDDEIWAEPDKGLIDRATREVRSTGLTRDVAITAGHVCRVHRSYPVYRCGYKERVAKIIDYLTRYRGLTPIGRAGTFKYNNQDHSILMGMLAAENILDDAGHDLWAVNTDYETYQEEATIDETGLVPAGGPS